MLEVGDYPCPAGGCLLTDKNFAKRIKDVIAHEGLRLEDITLLKVGRHFRLQGGAKLVVGRNEKENQRIEKLARDADVLMIPDNVMGPSALLRKTSCADDDIKAAASITAAFCDGQGDVTITCRTGKNIRTLRSLRRDRGQYEKLRC